MFANVSFHLVMLLYTTSNKVAAEIFSQMISSNGSTRIGRVAASSYRSVSMVLTGRHCKPADHCFHRLAARVHTGPAPNRAGDRGNRSIWVGYGLVHGFFEPTNRATFPFSRTLSSLLFVPRRRRLGERRRHFSCLRPALCRR